MKRATFVDIVTYLFILLFLYTGVMKFMDHTKFYWALYKSPLLRQFAPVLSWVLPSGEILIVLSLMLPRTRRLGLICSLSLMTIFTLYVGYMLLFVPDLHRPCTCGGVISLLNWHRHFYFNSGMTALAGLGVWLDGKNGNSIRFPGHSMRYSTSSSRL